MVNNEHFNRGLSRFQLQAKLLLEPPSGSKARWIQLQTRPGSPIGPGVSSGVHRSSTSYWPVSPVLSTDGSTQLPRERRHQESDGNSLAS